MDFLKIINRVKNINDYITFTQDLVEKYESAPIMLNKSNVLALKKIASFEVEYFCKCYKSGAAFLIFDQLLRNPPSKSWSLLGKELVSLLQYWGQRLLKHIITHCPHYQTFLKCLLEFINDIRLKDPTMSTTLVEQTAQCLLELATDDRVDPMHKLDVIKCLSSCCTFAQRAVRSALFHSFSDYFIKLSQYMRTCAHFPSQLAIVELLLRWLVQRQDKGVRRNAALLWFAYMCADALSIFLERPFTDFLKDGRDFLNAHNASNNDITSVVCRKLTIGGVTIIAGRERLESWMDVNSTQGCATILIDPRILRALGVTDVFDYEVINIAADNTDSACLHRQSNQIVLSIKTIEPTEFIDECALVVTGNSKSIMIYISSKSNMDKLDEALRRAFGDRFENMLGDQTADVSSSHSSRDIPETAKRFSETEEDVRFSVPLAITKQVFAHNPTPIQKRPKLSGASTQSARRTRCNTPSSTSTTSLAQEEDVRFSVPLAITKQVFAHNPTPIQKRPKRSGASTQSARRTRCNTPSSTSTTSLAQLHEKLANLPKIHYDKESLHVCLEPELSIVTERSEPEDSSFLNDTVSIYKLQTCQSKNCDLKSPSEKAKTSPSDNEEVRAFRVISASQSDEEGDETNVLFTTYLYDASITNDTLQCLKNNENTNLVDLLAQEALHPKSYIKEKDLLQDSGINTGNNKEAEEVNSEAIDNTPLLSAVGKRKSHPINRIKKTSTCIVVSKSTSDESNTEPYCPVPETELFATVNGKDKVTSTSDESVTDNNVKTTINNVTNRRKGAKKPNDDNAELNTIYGVQEKSLFNIKANFAQQNNQNEINISPTLAKENNQSRESSKSFDEYLASADQCTGAKICLEQFKIDPQIVECLNIIVDKVCNDFKECVEYKQNRHSNLLQELNYINEQVDLEKDMDVNKKNDKTSLQSSATAAKQPEKIKSIIKKTPKKDTTGKKKNNKKAENKLQPKSSNMKDKKIVQEVILENKDKPSTCKQNSLKEIEQDEPLTQENHSNLVKSKSDIYEQVEVTDFDVNKQYDEIVEPSCTIPFQQLKELKPTGKETKKKVILGKNNKSKITKEISQLDTPKNNKIQTTENIKEIVKSKNEIESPKNAINKNTSDEYKASVSPLQKKRKRKLYSPKDTDEIINDKHVTETLDERDEFIPLSKYKNKSKFNTPRIRLNILDIPTTESKAVCYKELEKVRKKHIRQSKRSKSKIKSSPLVSPRTLRNDQLFEKLKEGTNNNGVKLVDTNSSECNLAIYNFTSESEDEDFKKKKITVSACVDSITTKKGRVGRRKIKPESKTNSSTEEGTNHVIKKRKKPVKRQNTKAKEVNTNNITMKNLEDEKIRVVGHEDLSSSFIAVINQNDAQGEVEPILNNHSDLEIIPDIDYEKGEIQNSETKPRETKNNAKLSLKNEKLAKAKLLQKLQIIEEKNDRESPLPALLIETASKDTEDDQGSLVSSKLVKICNKLIQDGNYLNDTSQNLTIDVENINSSLEQPDIPLEIDIYEKQEISNDNYQRSALVKPGKLVPNKKLVKKIKETCDLTNINVNEKGNLRNDDALHFSELGITEEPIMIKEDQRYQKDTLPKRKQKQDKIEIEDDRNEKVSEKSIATADVEAESLSRQTLSQHIFRDLKRQDLNFSNREYFLQLRPAIGKNSSQNDASKETSCDFEIQEGDKNNYSQKENSQFLHTPVVSITRLSNDAFEKWLPSSRSSISEVNSQKIKLADIGENSSKTYNSKEATCYVETQVKVSNSKFTMAPVVSITRLSDDDFRKLLPSSGSSVSEVTCQKSIQKSNKVAAKQDSEITPVTKPTQNSDSNKSEDSQILKKANDKIVSNTKRNLDISKEAGKMTPKRRLDYENLEIKKLVAGDKNDQPRKILSVISPINFDTFEEAEEINVTKIPLEKMDYLLKNRQLFSQPFSKSKAAKEINPVESVSHESISQEANSSTENKEVNSTKRRPYTRGTSSKRRKVEMNSKIEMLSASGPSVNSVDEWFMKELPKSLSAREGHCNCKEMMQSILEKLDTTLMEINQNTSKKFMNLFLEMKHHFDTIEERRRQLSADASNQINRLFAELNERSADMQEEFICELRRRAAVLIREDNQQKRDMVVMLREDVETEMANLEGRRTP